MKKILILGLLACVVAGCSTGGSLVRPDSAKLVCKAEPGRPGVPGEPVTDEQNGEHLRDLRSAGADCRSKLQWVHDWLDAYFKALAKK